MKVKIGQKIRIGKSAKCIEALENFMLNRHETKPVLGRIAVVKSLTTFLDQPAVHLTFRSLKPIPPGDIKDPSLFFPVSVLRKP